MCVLTFSQIHHVVKDPLFVAAVVPPFHSAVDRAISYLDPSDGFLGVCDFFVSGRYDLPCRQLNFLRRFFWRCIPSCQNTLPHILIMSLCFLPLLLLLTVPHSSCCRCRATFDTDNIDVGPERRAYLDHRLSRVWEVNSQVSVCTLHAARTRLAAQSTPQVHTCGKGCHHETSDMCHHEFKVAEIPVVMCEDAQHNTKAHHTTPLLIINIPITSVMVSSACAASIISQQVHELYASVLQGSIPYVPFLRAPYYVWIGRVPQLATIMTETKTEAPSGFPATFLYTQSWEDPRPDMQVRRL